MKSATRFLRRALGMSLWVAAGAACGHTQNAGQRQCELGQRNSVFAPAHWPDRDLDAFASGKLGILDPRYDHFYLFIAYRQLSGKALTPANIDQLRTFDPCWNDGTRYRHGPAWSESLVINAAIEEWNKERSVVAGPPPQAARARSSQATMDYTPNCNADAYRHAARVLHDRRMAHGQSEFVKAWVSGQDAVFSHCAQKSDEMPAAAPADSPAWYRHDRAYQWAAAQFYAGHYQLAADSFDEIANDVPSPWNKMAPYLAARAYVRAANSGDTSMDATTALAKARSRLDRLVASTATPVDLQRDALRLIQLIRLRTEPAAVHADLARRLSAVSLPDSIGQDVRDFDPGQAPDAELLRDQDNFAAWLRAFREGVTADAPANPLWLLAHLQHAKAGDPQLAKLLAEGASLPKSSPGYLTARYHLLRLTSDHDAARRLAADLLRLPAEDLPLQDRNRIKALAVHHAKTMDEFSQLAYRQAIGDKPGTQSPIPVTDWAGAMLINGMPLDILRDIRQSPSTPSALRLELRGPVWVRAFVLRRWDVLHAMQNEMQAWLPKAAPLLKRMDTAATPEEKTALGALFLARHPGLNASVSPDIIVRRTDMVGELALPNMHRYLLEDGSRENWWCKISLPELPASEASRGITSPPPFLTRKARQQGMTEMRVMNALPNATDYLGREVLTWAQRHPRDEALPPALRMLVRSARGGCVEEATKEIGRRAFRHLHKYFPKSEEARLTHSHA